ncbi:MAG: phenylalanine--tRNA ligase subunit beta [Candidatus Omnitrophica bacterium]|nr:phenylalanine--tRNA ligase subunit beta [Candidatus Omnitrophota bacterium]
MKLSYEWLKEYVEIDVKVEELAHALTMTGSAVEEIKATPQGKTLQLEITSNRPDCLNMLGLAREAAAIYGKKIKMPDLSAAKAERTSMRVECQIKAKDLCQLYTARVIEGVHVGPTPGNIVKRLEAVDLRTVNNIVDVTNYCLMELGQPMHVFDLDRIKGAKVIVRKAVKGERLITIDGVDRELSEGMLIIADADGPIAIAGIMGGKNTEVTAGTKNVLLESACFDPVTVRRTARKLAISTDSSYRFERGIDKCMVAPASDRASKMIVASTGGKIGKLLEAGSRAETAQKIIKIDVGRTERLLGASIGKTRIKKIFRGLGLDIKKESAAKLKVKVPSFRGDLMRDIDLVEEVARIYGYDNIPSKVSKIIPQGERKEKPKKVDEKIRTDLAGAGWQEIMTYSMVPYRAYEDLSSISASPVEIMNPLSEEQKFLAPNLVDGMLKVISRNLNRKNMDLRLFEAGKIYKKTGPGEKDIMESPELCIGITGCARKNWKEGAVQSSFYDVKGVVERLLSGLRINTFFKTADIPGLVTASHVRIGNEKRLVGFAGEISPKTLERYDISQPVFIAQISLNEVTRHAVLEDTFTPVPRFPSAFRDVSVQCDKELEVDGLKDAMEQECEGIVKKVEIIDLYEGDKIPAGKKSLTFSIEYALPDRTLTDEEVGTAHDKIKKAVAEKFGVTYR